MSQLLIRVLIVCCVSVTSDFCSKACCQVFQNSRGPSGRAAAAAPRQPAVEGMAIAGDHRYGSGRRSGVNVVIPGPIIPSQRIGVPVYSHGQYSVLQYDAAENATVRTYSSRPGETQYSMRPVDRYGSHHFGNSHFGTQQYIRPGGQFPNSMHGPPRIRIYGRPPIPISPGYGPAYGGIVAPPIELPYNGSSGLPTQPPYSAVPNMTENGTAMPPVVPADERPIVDEFTTNSRAVEQPDIGTLDLIRSLRHQTSGDIAFRRQDYPSAEVFYKTAMETAPSRRAPWLRLAWTQIAEQRFSEAASNLKTALYLPDEPTSSWISGGLLFGGSLHTTAGQQDDQLWNWLQERPNSTDRLLLTAAFQELRGYRGVAQELLTVASQNGLPDTLHGAMQEIVNDIHRDAKPDGQPPSATPPPAIDNAPAFGENSIPAPQHHIDSLNPTPRILPGIGRPDALDTTDVDQPEVPSIPKDIQPAVENPESLPMHLPGLSQQIPVAE